MGVNAPFATIFDLSSAYDPPYKQSECARANAVCLSGVVINLCDLHARYPKTKSPRSG